MEREKTASETTAYDVVVVGAGFAGLYMLHRLRGLGFTTTVIEAGAGIGGTWFWNCYPGARCDIESMSYSYSFSPELEQEWGWTERYPTQPELLRYINHVADRFDLRRDIQLNTRVISAHFDEHTTRWNVTTDAGTEISAQYVIMATGNLSASKDPDFPGLSEFSGDWYMTASWPREGVDFTGKRVGVIGTGSSGIQVIQELAKEAEHVTVFQRTANFSMPAKNRTLDPAEQREMKANYRAYRHQQRHSPSGVPVGPPPTQSVLEVDAAEVREVLEEAWEYGGPSKFVRSYTDVFVNPDANQVLGDFVRAKIRSIVNDPEVAEMLVPTTHLFAAKRLCVDLDYFATFNRPNVTLVDVARSPIEAITGAGVRTTDSVHELDALVFAIGFDAFTGALLDIDIRGRAGISLTEAWREGPSTYLGLGMAGFPNLFTITGPMSPSVLSNMVLSIEQHVEWIADCLSQLRAQRACGIEVTPHAQTEWVQHVADVARGTIWDSANSWYNGANIAGKPRVFIPYIGGLEQYLAICKRVADHGYEGFVMLSPPNVEASIPSAVGSRGAG